MKVKLIRATFAALFLATCGIAQGGNDSDRKGDVTDEKPKDVRYGRHSFADSTLSGGRAADLPGGVVVKTPSPCDFDPDRCSPPGSGSGGSGVTPPVQPPVASCKKQAASNLGGYGSAGANMVAWASVFNEPADATITEVRADIGGARSKGLRTARAPASPFSIGAIPRGPKWCCSPLAVRSGSSFRPGFRNNRYATGFCRCSAMPGSASIP